MLSAIQLATFGDQQSRQSLSPLYDLRSTACDFNKSLATHWCHKEVSAILSLLMPMFSEGLDFENSFLQLGSAFFYGKSIYVIFVAFIFCNHIFV